MKSSIRVFNSSSDLASKLAEEIARRIIATANNARPFSIALSGGSTPGLLYSFLGEEYSNTVPWEFVHLFWGDERCVPPDHAESNYLPVRRHIIDKTGIPAVNVHRIRGEEEPLFEAMRYSAEISTIPAQRDKLPVFDLVLLGLGEDGHTASIFPDRMDLLNSGRICDVAVHPSSGQKRITITGKVINNAEAVVFLVTGNKKAELVKSILKQEAAATKFPAFHIKPIYGSLDWYLDKEAGSLVE